MPLEFESSGRVQQSRIHPSGRSRFQYRPLSFEGYKSLAEGLNHDIHCSFPIFDRSSPKKLLFQ